MNPYAVSEVEHRSPPSVHIEYPGHQIRAAIVFNEEYVLEAYYQHNILNQKRESDAKLYLNALLLGALAIGVAVIGEMYIISGLLVVLALVQLIPNLSFVQLSFVRRRLKSSPYRNEQLVMTFADEGVYGKSSLQDARLEWAAFTDASAVEQGVVLFQGKHEYRWVPFRCLENQADAPIFYNYVASRIAASKAQKAVASQSE